MSDLVRVENFRGQLVVSSREVAENFEKRHDHVLEAIDKITGQLNTTEKSGLFVDSEYKANNGKMNREFLLTRDGFTLLAMGFTGTKALQWKLKYIEAFNKMEETLKNPFKNLSKELQAILLLDEKHQVLENRLTKVENTMTIDYEQSNNLRELANSIVVKGLGGKNSQAYKQVSKQMFQAMWRGYKKYFSVNSYKNTAVKDYEKAVEYISNWEPDYNLKIEINSFNNQVCFAN